jgi:hypothetical protein
MDDRVVWEQVRALLAAIRPPQWEYKQLWFGEEDDLQTLQRHGTEGWEAVGMTWAQGQSMPITKGRLAVLLKRPKRPNER